MYSTLFLEACKANQLLDAFRIRALHADEMNYEEVDVDNQSSPLMWACYHRQEALALLLVPVSDLRLVNVYGLSVWHYASTLPSVMKLLIQQGFALDMLSYVSIRGNTPLLYGIISANNIPQGYDHNEIEDTFLRMVSVPNTTNPPSALVEACKNKWPRLAEALTTTTTTTTTTAKDEHGNTALHWACYHGYVSVVRALITSLPELFVANTDGNTPLHIAIMQQREAVATFLLSTDSVATGHLDLSITNAYGNTPLLLACKHNLPVLAAQLVTADPLVTTVNRDHWTALMYACYHDMQEVAVALLATGYANESAVNKVGETALMIAIASNHTPTVSLAILATNNANESAVNVSGNTALLYACTKQWVDVATALLNTGRAYPTAVNREGYTALIKACKYGLSSVALMLTSYVPHMVTYQGYTALLYACKNNMSVVAMALLATGQANETVIADQHSALHWCLKHDMTTTTMALLNTGRMTVDPFAKQLAQNNKMLLLVLSRSP